MSDYKLISVCMITYNHEKYIRQAVESVLSQEVNYPFELMIFNDASTDKTDLVIRDIIQHHPKGDLINYCHYVTNIGLSANYISSLKNCKGKYIAICEGDDYWLDHRKLQKQVDLLEADPNYTFCFHQAIRLNIAKQEYSVYPVVEGGTYSAEEFFQMPTIPMASVVFRNQPALFFLKGHLQCDFQLLCNLLTNGDAFFLKEVMSVYRVHEQGASYNHSSFHYVKKRADELYQETKFLAFSPIVRKQVVRICKSHTRSLLKSFGSQLSRRQRLIYRSRILRLL